MRAVWNALVFVFISAALCAQQGPPQPFMRSAVVQHRGASVVVAANDPRPLRQAITAVREAYGWLVDYEEPPYYSAHDLVDSTDPQWRASHPGAKGVRRIAGGAFQAEYLEGPNTATSYSEEEKVLGKIAADYNRSGNPGKFRVQKESDGRYAIIGEYVRDETGRDEHVSSILDTPISIPTSTRSADETVNLILQELSARMGVNVVYTTDFDTSVLRGYHLTLGGENVPARSFLLQTLTSTRRPLMFDLTFSTDLSRYLLRISVASLATTDSFGRRMTVPIDRAPIRVIGIPHAVPPNH